MKLVMKNHFIVSLLLSSLLSLVTSADTIFPKTGPVEEVVVVDVAQDMGLPAFGLYDDAHDAVATLAAFQGLINRQDSTTKVYLKNMPVRLFWNVNDGGSGSPDDIIIQEMKRDAKVRFAELDDSKSYPALEWLLDNYGHLVKGMVMMPKISDLGWAVDQPNKPGKMDQLEEVELLFAKRAAALNKAIHSDALPTTGLMQLVIGKRAAYYFPRMYIPNFKTAAEANQWSFDQFFNQPGTTKKLLGVINESSQNPPHMWDYWYATKTFVIGYIRPFHDNNPDVPAPTRAVAQFVEEVLAPEYAPGTNVFGEIEGAGLISHFQSLGFQIQQGPIPNLSATSAFETDPSMFKSAPKPKVHKIKKDGIYIAFNTIDGDAHDIAWMTLKGLSSDPAEGSVKMGVRYNPFFLDLNPLHIRWMTEYYRDSIDLIPSPHNGGIPSSAAAAAEYERCYDYFYEVGNQQFQVYNFFGEFSDRAGANDSDQWSQLMKSQNPLLCIRGYHGRKGDSPEWRIMNGVLSCNQIGWGRWEPDDRYRDIVNSIKGKKDGEPVFIMAKIPSEFGVRAWSMTKELVDRLKNDPEVAEKGELQVLLPRDIAATVRSYMEAQGVTVLSQSK